MGRIALTKDISFCSGLARASCGEGLTKGCPAYSHLVDHRCDCRVVVQQVLAADSEGCSGVYIHCVQSPLGAWSTAS